MEKGDLHPVRCFQRNLYCRLPIWNDRRVMPGGNHGEETVAPPVFGGDRPDRHEPVSRAADLFPDDVRGVFPDVPVFDPADESSGIRIHQAGRSGECALAGGTAGISAFADCGRNHRRSRRRSGFSAEHPDSVSGDRVSGRDRIHGAGRVCDGWIHAQVRTSRKELHPDAARVWVHRAGDHGDADD